MVPVRDKAVMKNLSRRRGRIINYCASTSYNTYVYNFLATSPIV